MTRREGRRTTERRPARAHVPTAVANVSIDAIAAGGDGVGRVDGLACFIPRTAPGDLVQAALELKARHARGRVLQLLVSSPARVAPTCRHYDGDACGGCQLQHLSLDAQLDAKQRIVRDALQRIGGRTVELPAIEGSPHAWHYRRKLTLTLVHRSHGYVGGLHPLDDADAVFPLEECPISEGSLLAAWQLVRAAAEWLPVAPVLRVMLRVLERPAHLPPQFAAVVTGGSVWTGVSQFTAKVPGLGALWWQSDAGVREVIIEPAEEDRAAASFLQVNRALAAHLLNYVEAQVRAFAPRRVIDAYAGIGLLSVRLARSAVHVNAIEWDRDAVALLQRDLPAGSSATAAAVETALPDALPADVVVLNPPRSGVDERVTQALANAAARGVRAIVYVSCDPATLARDLKRLPAWRIHSTHCFDMFPQTAHVETVCVLTPEAA